MADTSATPTLQETGRHAGVDVQAAEAEFNDLARRLTRTHETVEGDPEKGQKEEPFDLREYLRSSNDANEAAGLKHKHVGVTWEDLQVEVFGGADSKFYVPTFGDAILMFFLSPFFFVWNLFNTKIAKKVPPTRTILHKSSGVLKPGEMCLVLGCPNSGCTTFLKSISLHRDEYASVTGEVLYAGMDAEEMIKHYKGEVVYNEEDDIHIPTLSVAQTLAFALSTKTPGPKGRLPGVTRKEFDKEVQDLLLSMLNIKHTKNTLVGDAFVRGVSGGERRRVSIAEMMASRSSLNTWDNSTRGLDASTALDFIKSLRIMTDLLGRTTFVSLYQAGESIYELFDKVLLLDHGRVVYYGPGSNARAYFEQLGYNSLPRQTTADYLTGCTDPNERQFAPGRSAQDVPSTPEALENYYLSSPTCRDMDDSLQKYKLLMETEKTDQEVFRAAVAADRKKGVSSSSPYTRGFFGQVSALTRREFLTRLQDKFQLYTSYTLNTILAFVIGAAFFDLPLTSAGAFTRGGVLFTAILTTCLDAFGEIPMQMLGRPILRKQTNYRMYRPAAVALARLASDIPFSASRVLIFNIIVYFMTNLHRSAGGFFVYHLFSYLAYLAMQAFFRTFGLLCRSFDSAFRLAVFFVPNMIQYSGYMIPVDAMKRWLFWIYYINPISFAWESTISNEFMRIDLTCDGNSVVPRNGPGVSKYPDQAGINQSCTLFGATSGSSNISGRSYIQIGYGILVPDMWRRNFIVLLAFFAVFVCLQLIALEYFPQHSSGASVNIYAKEDSDAKAKNLTLQERRQQRLEAPKGEKSSENKIQPRGPRDTSNFFRDKSSFTWEKINYHVPVPGGQRRLLHNVSGFVKPGMLVALMGASGAGKTTCLDVLAQRKNIGVITGDLLVDGRPLPSDFARGTAYAEQMDVHEGTATVREALRFSAYLRQPAAISEAEKDEYVEEIIELLELQDLSEALVFSLSVEARKRLTIGVELASKPELLLFLDEPTSGLDGQSAWNLVRFLRKLAGQGQALVATIHQPSNMLFLEFDALLLLEAGGETVYFGPIGRDSQVIRDYFSRYGAHCPSHVNPAEYMLDAIGAGLSPRVGDTDWKDIWLASPEYQKMLQDIETIKADGLAKGDIKTKKTSTYATSFFYQLKVVFKRNNIALWRSPDYIFTRLFVCSCISLFVSLPLLQLGNSARDLQYRIFGAFWITVLPIIVMAQIEPLFIMNRQIFIREQHSRIYSPVVFAVAQLLGELPYDLVCAICYWALMVFPMGWGQATAGTGGQFFQLLVIVFVMLFGVSFGQLIAALSPSIQVAVLFNPFFGLTLGTFCGVTIPYPTMISFWRSWLYQVNPYTRTLAAILSTELHGLVIQCKADEFAVFNPPSGQTCLQWAGDFVRLYGGYVNNPDATEACQYCQYSVGDEFFVPLNMRYENRWRDGCLLLAYFAFNVIATVIASRYLRYAKR